MPHILFLTLKVFSATGGIEKVCRVAGKALYEYGIEHDSYVSVYSMHDPADAADHNRYFPSEQFRGFNARKLDFIQSSVAAARKADIVILSHINLILVAWLIKKISPSTTIILFAHGIEIWGKLSSEKKMMLDVCDKIVSVSNFTSQKIREVHNISSDKCTIMNNCLDPFLPLPSGRIKNKELLDRYGFAETDTILFTLCRLAARERYKGYDKVLQAIVQLKNNHPHIRYLLAGSYDPVEKKYLDDQIIQYNLESVVVMPGYISDAELQMHFSLADIYIMPSMKEGFGIVFVEAMNYGLPVIAGNMDGSVDALINGQLGLLVDPTDTMAITEALEKILQDPDHFIPDRDMLLTNFSYDSYKNKFEQMLQIAFEKELAC